MQVNINSLFMSFNWELSWNSNKKLSDVTDKIKSGLGMPTEKAGAGSKGMGSAAPMDIPDNISSGGSKPTNITINLGKLHENIIINSQNLKEGVQDMEKQITEALLRVLNSGNAMAGR
jgi:hypothetical protein